MFINLFATNTFYSLIAPNPKSQNYINFIAKIEELETKIQEEKVVLEKQEKDNFIMDKENEFLEKKIKDLNKEIDEQTIKIQEELTTKNTNIGTLYLHFTFA